MAWIPNLERLHPGVPKHKALAEAIVSDIDKGLLNSGDRMPTHRALAQRLKVSVQTVSVAYREAERLGYLQGEVGRGTFVRTRLTEGAGSYMLDIRPQDLVDLSIVRAAYGFEQEKASRQIFSELSESENAAWMRACRPVAGSEWHRNVGSKWLSSHGLEVPGERLVITNGGSQGLFLALSSIIQRDDVVLTESLTDHGVIGCANVLGFTLRGLPTDEQGIMPEALDDYCRHTKVRALVCTPTYSNPTGALASLQRRRKLAEVAAHHGVYVIEDEVYRPLCPDALPAIASFIPELAFYSTSFTKSVLTGLRCGYLVVPTPLTLRVASILRVTGWMATPLLAEIASRWVEDGTAVHLVDVQRREMRARQQLVMKTLGEQVIRAPRNWLAAWVSVPDYWSEEALLQALRERGVAVTISDPFMTLGARRPNAIRICLGGQIDRTRLEEALVVIRDTFQRYPAINATGFLS